MVGSATPELYDTSPHNLFPIVLRLLAAGKTPQINGDDYPTPDGTCVRDYIHVADLAPSHVAAAKALDAGHARWSRCTTSAAATGVSVREIMTAIAEVTGIDFEPRRSRRGAPATRRASSPPANWPRVTSTGRCGTR